MTSPIDVLVVIVNYRTAALTLRSLAALRSECSSSEIRLSVVVVENASGDADALARGIDRDAADFARLVVSPRNGGFGSGNNLGLRAARELGARPRYVHFLNPDTVIRPGAVIELARFLESHPRVGVAGSSFQHADGTPWRVAFRFPTALGELEGSARLGVVTQLLRHRAVARELAEEPVQVDWVSGASFMVRSEVLESVGSFDEGYFLYWEETDLMLRIRAAGWECWYVPGSRVSHIRGQSTGVTALSAGSQRLPEYWFESRRRYFTKNHGLRYALFADVAFLVGSSLGALRDRFKGELCPELLLRDIVRHSVIWPRNRRAIAAASRR